MHAIHVISVQYVLMLSQTDISIFIFPYFSNLTAGRFHFFPLCSTLTKEFLMILPLTYSEGLAAQLRCDDSSQNCSRFCCMWLQDKVVAPIFEVASLTGYLIYSGN